MRRQIENLIEADPGPDDFLERPLLEVLSGTCRHGRRSAIWGGRRIEGCEVISRLGAGGIGEVWLARDTRLEREVALKLLSPRFAASP